MFLNFRTEISVGDILIRDSREGPSLDRHTILIEGIPGSGKSTMCDRIAYQWAQDETDIVHLKEFKLVILVKLSLIKDTDDTIFDYIKRVLLPGISNIETMIKREHVLFILDGFDEFSGNGKVVTDVLRGIGYSKTTTSIVTSRHRHNLKLHDFTNQLDILPLTHTQVENFISKMNSDGESNLDIDLNRHPLRLLITTPLFLWFYVILGGDLLKDVKGISRTVFYHGVVRSIMSKAVDRLGYDEDCEKGFTVLQEIAFHCSCESKVHFKNKLDLVTEKLGFVKKTTEMMTTSISSQIVYTFMHKTMLEFFCALYITRHHHNDISGLLRKIPELHNEQQRSTSMILFFVCGLIVDSRQLCAIFSDYMPDISEQAKWKDGHKRAHVALEHLGEISDVALLGTSWQGRVQDNIVLANQECTQYCAIGLHKLLKHAQSNYTLTSLTISYGHSHKKNTLGDPSIMRYVLSKARWHTLRTDRSLYQEVMEDIKEFYDDPRAHLEKLSLQN